MQELESQDYFHRRAEEERAAAEHAADERAAQTHRELAQEYEKRAHCDGNGAVFEDEQPQDPGTLHKEFRILP
jgi:hypothetical protein